MLLILQVLGFEIGYAEDNSINLNQSAKEKKLKIASSINPLYQIILSITGNKADNFLIFKSNFSEHNYQLKSDDVKVLQQADLVFMIDKNYEKTLFKLIQNSSIKDKYFEVSNIEKLTLFKTRNSFKIFDFHLWLNPENAELIAESLVKNLCVKDQKNCQFYQQNLLKFRQENQLVINLINKKLIKIKEQNFIFYHDCYQYFERYFKVSPIMIIDYDHAVDVKIKKLKSLDEIVKNNKIKCLFGDINDEKNSALKIAKNYQINFQKLDVIGLNDDIKNKEKKLNLNGYSIILLNIVDNIEKCLE
jgi:zinc transport system substrate-binding protein